MKSKTTYCYFELILIILCIYAYVYLWIHANGTRYWKMPKDHVEFHEAVDVGICELSGEGFVRYFLDEVRWV